MWFGRLAFVLSVVSVTAMGCSAESDNAADKGPYPDNPYAVWRHTLDLPAGSPVMDHAEPSDCANATGDDAIFECANQQFWRVFQRDINDRKAVWHTMVALEEKLSENADPIAKASFIFRRAQIAMTYILEQTDVTPENMGNLTSEDIKLLTSMASDMSAAIKLDPNEPFYVTWLDTVNIATADRLQQPEKMLEAVDEAWVNVEKWTKETTRSTLVASLSGTTIGVSIASGVPHKTIKLLETFACHPDVLMKEPDAICGKDNDRRACVDWCLANSKKAPYTGPGMMYHIGEAYARMGDTTLAQQMYELALTLPGTETWPYRKQVEDALADMGTHMAQFTQLKDEETASYVVYANSEFGCRFCHGNP